MRSVGGTGQSGARSGLSDLRNPAHPCVPIPTNRCTTARRARRTPPAARPGNKVAR